MPDEENDAIGSHQPSMADAMPPAAIDMPRGAAGAAGPVQDAERIATLDVLRGFALLGIFMVNMPMFALPFMQGMADPELLSAPLSERLAASFVKLFFEYKFISLFSLLFGIGFIVQISRAKARGGSFVPQYLRRLVILFVIGLVHALGLWYGDILLLYSLIGVVLLLLAWCSARLLMMLAGAALVVGAVLMFGIGMLQYVMISGSAEQIEQMYGEAREVIAAGDAPSGFEAIGQANFDPNHPFWVDAELRAYRDGPLAHAFAFRATTYSFALVFAFLGYGWHVLAMFLLGAGLMKLNFFAAHRRHWHMRLACIALPLGLLLEGIYATYVWFNGVDLSIGYILLMPMREVGSVTLMLGYVGVICTLMHSEQVRTLSRPLANAGRMALTVYLSETLIATACFYWWGLGWFGSVDRMALIGLVLAIYAGLVIFATIWLRFFRFGPMEWLWRSLTYMRPQPLRREAMATDRAVS